MGNLWWDGYDGQETVLLDDYTGWLPMAVLLRLLDRYPMTGQVKGGQTWLRMKTIIITSNFGYQEWYKDPTTRFLDALQRRIHTIWHCETLEQWTRTKPALPSTTS